MVLYITATPRSLKGATVVSVINPHYDSQYMFKIRSKLQRCPMSDTSDEFCIYSFDRSPFVKLVEPRSHALVITNIFNWFVYEYR